MKAKFAVYYADGTEDSVFRRGTKFKLINAKNATIAEAKFKNKYPEFEFLFVV